MTEQTQSPQTYYEAIGGHDTIKAIVDRFYAGVATDDILKPMYPEDDLGPAAHRFTMFLEQYWGGPTTYSQQRGHPRLRMRHAPYAVTPQARDRWLLHFRAGLDSVSLPAELDAQFWTYVVNAGEAMINTR